MRPDVECTYERLSAENLHWFMPLFRKAYGKKITLEQVKKKYDHSLLGKPYLGLYAMYEGRPVAFVGICYYQAVYRGKTEWAANFTDVMVHPDFQGRGVFVKLLAALEDLAKENGICFSLVFANDRSFGPMLHKRKWIPCCQLTGFLIDVKTLPLRRIYEKLGMENAYLRRAARKLKPYTIPYSEGLFNESDDLPRIVHDEKFYRYRDSPAHFLLKLEGEAVWVRLGVQLAVGFIGPVEEEKMLKIVKQLKELARKLYIRRVMLQFTHDSPQHRALQNHFTGFRSWNVLHANQQSAFPLEQLQLQYCDVDSF